MKQGEGSEPLPEEVITRPPESKEKVEAQIISEQIKQYESAVREIVRSVYSAYVQDRVTEHAGGIDGIAYRRLNTYRGGKQQPVTIIELTFPTGVTAKVVCKKDSHQIAARVEKHPALNNILPTVYLDVDGVLVIEHIEGLELDKVEQLLNQQEDLKEQLASDAVNIVDDLVSLPFVLNDVNFPKGHNVIFDSNTHHFRVFDVHSISEAGSMKTYGERLLNFVDLTAGQARRANRDADMKNIDFLVRYIRHYLKKHPEGFPVITSKRQTYLKLDDPRYEAEYQKTITEDPSIARFMRMGTPIGVWESGELTIDPEIIKASLINDEVEVARLLKMHEYRATSMVV